MKKLQLFILLFTISLQVLSYSTPTLIPYRAGDKWGYCDKNKKIIIPILYHDARPFHCKRAAVKTAQGWCFINNRGEIISGFYDEVQDFSEDRASVRKDLLWGVIDKNGKEIVKPNYEFIGKFNDGCCWVLDSNRKYGIINSNGKLISGCIYDWMKDYNSYRTVVAIWDIQHPKYYVLNRKGKVVFDANKLRDAYGYKNVSLGYFSERRCQIIIDTLVGYLNKRGKIVIAPKYYSVAGYSEGVAFVQNFNDKIFLINKKGKVKSEIIHNPGFTDWQYKCGRQPFVADDEHWGFIDKRGKVVIQPIYFGVCDFTSGVASVKNEQQKWGFIDRNGRMITDYIYDENKESYSWSFDTGYTFFKGLCRVIYGGRPGYIDTKGNRFWEE